MPESAPSRSGASGQPPWTRHSEIWGRAPDAWRTSTRPPWPAVLLGLLAQAPTLAIAMAVGQRLLVVFAVLAIVGALAVAASRRLPTITVPVVGALVGGALLFVPGVPTPAVPLLAAIVVAVLRGKRLAAWLTVAGLGLVLPIVGALVLTRPGAGFRPLAVLLVLCLVIALTDSMRSRRERYRRLGEQLAAERRADTEAERTRIARELHDVLAHSLSQISVQAGVGLHLFDQRPEAAREALSSIRVSSREALDEVRSVLGMLRGESQDDVAPAAPEPDLTRLPALVDAARSAGTTVHLAAEAPDGVPPPLQRAAYRIVQESLTNVRRHASATRVLVSVAARDDGLEVRVENDGAPAATIDEGRGIRGMHERAVLAGGRLSAGPVGDGRFVVDAWLPLEHPTGGAAS